MAEPPSVKICCFCALVRRQKLRCLLQGLTLFNLNPLQALLCAAAGFGVGHAEHVIGFHTLVHTRVAWDRVTEGDAAFLFIDAVEGVGRVFCGLVMLIVLLRCCVSNEARLSVINLIGTSDAIELINRRGRNWLQ